MNNLKRTLLVGSLFFAFLGIFTAGLATDGEDNPLMNSVTRANVQSDNLAWDRFKEIGKIWGRNTIQIVDIFGCMEGCYERLPVVSRDTRAPIIYLEDRLGWALAPLNWLWYLGEEHLPSEGPKTMCVRGCFKKYNEAVRARILPNGHPQ